jgi:hypothetical protein
VVGVNGEGVVGIAGRTVALGGGAGTTDEVDGSTTAGEGGREAGLMDNGGGCASDAVSNESSSSISVISSRCIIPSVEIESERLPLMGSGRALAGFLRSVVINSRKRAQTMGDKQKSGLTVTTSHQIQAFSYFERHQTKRTVRVLPALLTLIEHFDR